MISGLKAPSLTAVITSEKALYKLSISEAAKEDVDVMAAALGLRIDQQSLIPLLQQGQAVITCDKDDAASWVKINKPKIMM